MSFIRNFCKLLFSNAFKIILMQCKMKPFYVLLFKTLKFNAFYVAAIGLKSNLLLGGTHKLRWQDFEDFWPCPLRWQVHYISLLILYRWDLGNIPLPCQRCLRMLTKTIKECSHRIIHNFLSIISFFQRLAKWSYLEEWT